MRRTSIAVALIALLVPSVTVVVPAAGKPEAHEGKTLRDVYGGLYRKVQHRHGTRAPGRHIVLDGVRGDKPASDHQIAVSIRRMRVMLNPPATPVAPVMSNISVAPTPTAKSVISAPTYTNPGGGAPPESIAQCESGGNPAAVSPGGAYRGKWQFDQGTWQSVGGKGDPAAAPESEQDYRAGILYRQRGASPWPVCGR